MTQKSDIEEMLDAGKGYDEIQDRTGSNRSYIRSIAVNFRKRAKEEPISEEEEEQQDTPAEPPSMNFVDDVTPPKKPVDESESKTGSDYHKEWVKAAKYECGSCGATVGRTSDFCPHCGQTLSWDGIE